MKYCSRCLELGFLYTVWYELGFTHRHVPCLDVSKATPTAFTSCSLDVGRHQALGALMFVEWRRVSLWNARQPARVFELPQPFLYILLLLLMYNDIHTFNHVPHADNWIPGTISCGVD
jgi:hypothetical protein